MWYSLIKLTFSVFLLFFFCFVLFFVVVFFLFVRVFFVVVVFLLLIFFLFCYFGGEGRLCDCQSLYVILSVSVFSLGRELPVGQALTALYIYANSNAAHQPVQYFSYYTFQTMNNKDVDQPFDRRYCCAHICTTLKWLNIYASVLHFVV